MAGLRNRLAHDCLNIDFVIIWDVVHGDLPNLISHIGPLVPPEDQV